MWQERLDGYWDVLVQWEAEVIARRGPSCCFIDAHPRRPLTAWAAAWEQGVQEPLFEPDHAACDGGYCMV